MSIDAEINALKTKVQAAMTAKYRAEATRETQQKQLDHAMSQLKDKFGLDNLQDARAKLAELQQDLTTKVEQATKLLNDMNL